MHVLTYKTANDKSFWLRFCLIRKVTVKVENDDGEGHPPGENEEEKSDDQSETV